MPPFVITGASSGIGHALARHLAAAGERVIGIARRAEAMPAGVTPVTVDLARPGAGAAALEARLGRTAVDALVHCAGYGDFVPLELTSADDARRQLQVNLLSAAELVQSVLPGMREAGRGRIVLVSSIASRFSSPMGGWYHTSKAALESYADTLRQETAGFGIDVIVVQPGVVRTPWYATATKDLVARTAGTPYEQAGAAAARYHRRSSTAATACEADDVVATIVHALAQARPRTRYLVGRGARTAVLLPRLVGDRTYDALVQRQFGIPTVRR